MKVSISHYTHRGVRVSFPIADAFVCRIIAEYLSPTIRQNINVLFVGIFDVTFCYEIRPSGAKHKLVN